MRRLLWTIAICLSLAAPLSAATVDGLEIHSSSAGTGEATVIFIHGWTCDSSSWTAQVPAFAKKYRVLTLDLPGHGQSAAPKDGSSRWGFSPAPSRPCVPNRNRQIVLVGHSMGAPVIRQYARLYPQHVAGLVAVDGPLDLRGVPPPNFQQPPPTPGPGSRRAKR